MKNDLVGIITDHHAVCVTGSRECREEVLQAVEEAFGVSEHGHPDLYVHAEPRLSIESARSIRELQLRKPVSAERTVVIIESSALPTETQNALLKSFEEPSANAVFILIIPQADMLLPTLRSRLVLVSGKSTETFEGADAFLTMSYAERLSFIEPITKEKDKAQARVLIDDLEQQLATRWRGMSDVPREERAAVSDVLTVKQYLGDQGSSVKQILEFASLRLPVIPKS